MLCGLLRDVGRFVFCVCFLCALASVILCLCVLFVIYCVMLHRSFWGCFVCACVCVFLFGGGVKDGIVDAACDLLCDAVRFVCCLCVLSRVWACVLCNDCVYVCVIRL